MDDRSRIGSYSRVVVKEEEREEEERSSFQVPSHLVEKYGGVMPSKVTLTTDESEKRWNLSIENFHGEYFFTDGWKEFEEGVGLGFRTFLMYKPDASSKQKGKKNKERRTISGNALGTTNSSLNENQKGCDAKKRLSFSEEMKEYHRYRLDIPRSFVRSTGICEKDIIILKVKDIEGKEWPVNVTKRAAIFSLCAGWIEFVADNKVTLGSRISFAWLSKSTILTQILEVGTEQLLIDSTSRRGKQLELLELSDSDVNDENEDDISEENCVGVGKKWRFRKVLKKKNANELHFPMSFAMVVGQKTSGEIQLMDSERRTWPLKYKRHTSFRLATGWIDFLVANKASVGSMVVFKSLPNCNKVLEVQVMDRGLKHKALFVKKPRGRPRLRSLK